MAWHQDPVQASDFPWRWFIRHGDGLATRLLMFATDAAGLVSYQETDLAFKLQRDRLSCGWAVEWHHHVNHFSLEALKTRTHPIEGVEVARLRPINGLT